MLCAKVGPVWHPLAGAAAGLSGSAMGVALHVGAPEMDVERAAVAGLTWLNHRSPHAIVPGLNLLHFARAQPAEVAKNGLIVWVAWRIG